MIISKKSSYWVIMNGKKYYQDNGDEYTAALSNATTYPSKNEATAEIRNGVKCHVEKGAERAVKVEVLTLKKVRS